MKSSDAIAIMLERHGIEYCFELIGGMITHIVDSLDGKTNIDIISMHHEQAAAFAAEGVARFSKGGSLSVAMGTSGPGATNLLTGICSCWFDSIPCLFITGQVNYSELKLSPLLRQQGFQELDIVSMANDVTKYATQISDVSQLLPKLHKAMSTALSGRKGPVLLDIPNDIQRMEIDDETVREWLEKPLAFSAGQYPNEQKLIHLKYLCSKAKQPLVCFGGGAAAEESHSLWIHHLEKNKIPYVATLMGQRSILDSSCYQHMIGAYGNREANWALQHCDLLLVLGARLSVRQTGIDLNDFARRSKIVQVDIDAAQLNNRVKADLSICCGLNEFFKSFICDEKIFPLLYDEWLNSILKVRAESEIDEYNDWKISPFYLMQSLNKTLSNQHIHYICDVGNHQMWAAQSIRLQKGQSIHHNGGMGAMGFSLPAAIGVALASKEKTIVITGDGGVQINIQELDTIQRLGLNIIIIVLNNFSLGMVKNFQDMYFDGRNRSTFNGYSTPSFANVAESYGIKSVQVASVAEWVSIENMLYASSEPLLVEVLMEGATECRPRLTFGDKLDKQYPTKSC